VINLAYILEKVAQIVDKYEFNIKLEQIKKLSEKKDFTTAAKIAKAMDLRKVKDWTTLSLIINVQESAGDFDEARDIAIIAYNRNLGGRRLVYKLTELFIKLGELSDAEGLYKEYVRMSQLDVNKYILLYDLKKAQNASDTRLIEILEEYKDHEIDEKYLCELAELYSKTGMVEECLKECEEIALWFQEGIYVEKALRIKKQYEQLTTAQQKILDNVGKQEEVDIEKIIQLNFAQAKQKARLLEDEIEDVFIEDAQKSSNEEGISILSKENNTNMTNSDYQNLSLKYENSEDSKGSEGAEDSEDSQGSEGIKNLESLQNSENSEDTDESNDDNGVENSDGVEGIAKAGQSLRQLIENAKKKIEFNYQQVKREDEEERIQEQIDNIEVPVANFNLYDAQNVQNELAKSLDEIMKKNPEEEDRFKALSFWKEQTEKSDDPDAINEEDEQVEGQLSLLDWIEAIQEEKYGKQNTKEFSKAELDSMLEQRENEKDEYEKLLAKQKQQAEANGELFNEDEARRHAEEQVILQSAKNNLTMRTGKATAKLEAEAENLREVARLTAQIEERAAKEADRVESEAKLEAELKAKLEAEVEAELEAEVEAKLEAEVKAELELEAEVEAEKEVVNEDEFKDINENDNIEELQEEPVSIPTDSKHKLDEVAATESEYMDTDCQEAQEAYDNMVSDYAPEDMDEKCIGIPKSVKKYFKKYSEMSGLEDQLAQYFAASKEANMMTTSEIGNIIVSGNRSSDKTNLTVSIIKALNTLYPDMPRKIAKTTGESINHKGIAKAMSKLKGTALIVEDAGVIEPKRIKEMLKVMESETEGMIVIFEDADTEINVLLSVNPDLAKKFNYRIVLKQYTVNELVEMAKKYAGKRQHAIDDNALLQLYLKIDRLHSQIDCVRLDQIKEIIDRAIVKAEKRASRKFFGTIKKKRGDNGDIFFLTEVDFKD